MEAYGKHVLSPDFDITEREEVVEASSVFLRKIAVLESNKRVDGWTVPP